MMQMKMVAIATMTRVLKRVCSVGGDVVSVVLENVVVMLVVGFGTLTVVSKSGAITIRLSQSCASCVPIHEHTPAIQVTRKAHKCLYNTVDAYAKLSRSGIKLTFSSPLASLRFIDGQYSLSPAHAGT